MPKEVQALNAVWLFMVISGCIVALATKNVDAMMSSVLEGAYEAIQLVISLAGVFCLWVGIEHLAKESGLVEVLARMTRPVLGPLFPYLRDEERVMGAISATVISNLLGLSSQTPLGLEAMNEIKKVCGESDRAIHSMITLVIIGAAGFCLFPSGIIALRSALGSKNPAIIAGPTAVAGLAATCAGLLAHKLLSAKR